MSFNEFGDSAEILQNTLDDIMNNGNKGEQEELEDQLKIAFRRMQSYSNDNNIIALSMKQLGSQVALGIIKTSDIVDNALTVLIQTIVAENASIDQEDSNKSLPGVIRAGAASITLGSVIENNGNISRFDQNLIKLLCDDKMISLHANTFDLASTDENACLALKLINTAINYMAKSDLIAGPQTNGAETPELSKTENDRTINYKSGALALIYQLVQTQNPEAFLMAKKLAEFSGLENVFDKEGGTNLDAIQKKFDLYRPDKPGYSLDGAVQRNRSVVAEKQDTIVAESSRDLNVTVRNAIDNKNVVRFSREIGDAVKKKDVNAAIELIQNNLDLAQKTLEEETRLFDTYIKGKREEPEDFALIRALLKETLKEYLKEHSNEHFQDEPYPEM